MFALVCGYLPFEDPNTANLYKKILNGEFNIPKAASESVRDMIKNILQTNPEIRYRVQEIRKHPWYMSQQLAKITGGIFIGLSQIPINSQIVDKLVTINFKREYVIKCINANKHNHATTSYYLLLKKAELAGEVKDSDFQFFDDKKLAEEKKELEAKTSEMMAILPPVVLDQIALNKTQPIKEMSAYSSKVEGETAPLKI